MMSGLYYFIKLMNYPGKSNKQIISLALGIFNQLMENIEAEQKINEFINER